MMWGSRSHISKPHYDECVASLRNKTEGEKRIQVPGNLVIINV